MGADQPNQIDPITLSVTSNRLLAIAEAMGEALVRSAFSPNIKERRDCSTAVFDREGALVAQAEHIPLHLGSMLGVVEAVLDQYGEEIQPGDAFVANDPYLGGGTHLPDVTVVSPFFYDSRLAGFAANVAHHADIGARVPGGISGDACSIEEEGLRIPPTRLATAGGLCEELLELFASRCRMPQQRRLDLQGQVAANRLGLAHLSRLFDDYGPQVMQVAMHALLAATEERMRRAVGELPDGSYAAADSVEGVAGEGPIPIAVQVDVAGDRLHFDFAESGGPSLGAINVPLNALLATVYYALKACLDPGLASNAGLHRSVEVSVPQVSILNARAPSAVGARTDTCQCVAGCIISAFSQARPGRLPAPSNDASTAVVFSGSDPRSGADYVYVEAVAGGAGAGPDRDGMEAVQVHITNTSNLPVEALEHAFPLLVERYELAPDSGGPGEFRGGLGVVRAVRVLEGGATFSAHGDRHERPARGAAGGAAGGVGAYVIEDSSGRHRKLPSKVSGVKLVSGDRVEVRTPGGGGYGRPAEREPELLRDDVRNGVVSPEQAGQAYGFDPESEGGRDGGGPTGARDSSRPAQG